VDLRCDGRVQEAACGEPVVAVVQEEPAVEADEEDRRHPGRLDREAPDERAHVGGQHDLLLGRGDVDRDGRVDRDDGGRRAERGDVRAYRDGDPERRQDLGERDGRTAGGDVAKLRQGAATPQAAVVVQVSGRRIVG
jgi:hypothetical protein